MATTTPNFGWVVPTSTDLVKDGATAIETLGDSIDASLLDLKGGTSGQVLAKNSNTDMDFVWVAQDDSNAIQNAIVDAKGDLIAATAADTPARLAVGANNTVLTADSSEATGMKWAAAAGGGKLLQLVNNTYSTNFATTSTTYVDTGMSTTITPTSATSKVFVMYNGNHRVATAGGAVNIRILRGATQIKLYNAQLYTGTNPERGEITLTWLDSPATTSATTYKIQICNDVTSSIEAQLNNEASVLTLMEIGA
jgi:hypothetical protein